METQLETGCYIDGTHGIYGPKRLAEIAQGFGWTGEIESADSEHYWDMADEIETWLNDNVATEGFSFGWCDGEFYYYSDSDWQEAYGI